MYKINKWTSVYESNFIMQYSPAYFFKVVRTKHNYSYNVSK
jgi:hypothetical protein